MNRARFIHFSLVASLGLVGCGAGTGTSRATRSAASAVVADVWAEDERKQVAAYWSAPGRYKVEPAAEIGERVNITVPGSTWYLAYNQAAAKQPKEVAAAWQAWVDKKLASDRAAVTPGATPAPAPGDIPAALKTAVGDPPPLYEVTKPLRYTVTFAPEDAPAPFVYVDNIPYADRKNYMAYYRSTNGVIRFGKKVKEYTGDERKKLDAVFESVGGTPLERHVLQAVSSLEGGFEAVNTYDTGFVSIGFIQFITARDGTGSLSAVLDRMKGDEPDAFRDTFQRFGIGVADDHLISAVDPATGREVHGADAVRAIIDDKRLTAVFERAGGTDAFRRAQVRVARDRYWPAEDAVTVTLGPPPSVGDKPAAPGALMPSPVTLTCKAGDIVKSEAGIATLMDRKVNRGNIRLINEVATKMMQKYNLMRLEDLAAHERELVAAMKYRHDFLADPALTQPAPPK